MTSKYYSVEEIAKLLNVNIVTVRRWIANSKIKAIKLGKAYRITEEDLQEFLKKGY